jgi:hypothetical protein
MLESAGLPSWRGFDELTPAMVSVAASAAALLEGLPAFDAGALAGGRYCCSAVVPAAAPAAAPAVASWLPLPSDEATDDQLPTSAAAGGLLSPLVR